MITVSLAVFFYLYHGIGSKITNKYLLQKKRTFNLWTFKKVRHFAFSRTRQLMEEYYSLSKWLLRLAVISFITIRLMGGIPVISPFLFLAAVLLLIAFTSPKQLKLDYINALKFHGQGLLSSVLGVILIWLVDWYEGSDFLNQIVNALFEPINQIQQQRGYPVWFFWTIIGIGLIAILLIQLFSWAVLTLSMKAVIFTLKQLAKFCFWLNFRRPHEPAYLIFQITSLIVSFAIEKPHA